MSLFDSLFKPKIEKLKDRGDISGLSAILASDSKPELRMSALGALVDVGGEGVVETVVAILGDPDAAIDQAAEETLGSLGSEAAEGLVAGLSASAGDRALGLLLNLGDESVEPLRSACGLADEFGRQRAVNGLIEVSKKTEEDDVRELCFRTLLSSLGDRAPACRTAAAIGLAGFADERAAKALAARLKDGDETVRHACRDTLATIGSAAFPYLVDALADRNRNSRLLAGELLGEVCADSVEIQDRQSALSVLVELVGDQDDEVRRTVTATAARIPASDIIENLLEHLEDPTIDDREETAGLVRLVLKHGSVGDGERLAATRRLDTLGPFDEDDY